MSTNPLHPYVEDYFSDDNIEQETFSDDDDKDSTWSPSSYGTPDYASDSGYSSNHSHFDGSEKGDYHRHMNDDARFEENLAQQQQRPAKPQLPTTEIFPTQSHHYHPQVYPQTAPPQQYFSYPLRPPFRSIRPPSQQQMQYQPSYTRPLYLSPPYYQSYHPMPVPMPYPAITHRYSYPIVNQPPPPVFYTTMRPVTVTTSYGPVHYSGYHPGNGLYHGARTSQVTPHQAVKSPYHTEGVHLSKRDSTSNGVHTEKVRPKTWPDTTQEEEVREGEYSREYEYPEHNEYRQHGSRQQEHQEEQAPESKAILEVDLLHPAHSKNGIKDISILRKTDNTDGEISTDIRSSTSSKRGMKLEKNCSPRRLSQSSTWTQPQKLRTASNNTDSELDDRYSHSANQNTDCAQAPVRHPAPLTAPTSATGHQAGARGHELRPKADGVNHCDKRLVEERVRRRYAFVYN